VSKSLITASLVTYRTN